MTARDYPRIVVPPPGPKAQQVVARDAEWTSTCYIKEYPLVVSRGRGVMVEDVDGNRYLDFMAGIVWHHASACKEKSLTQVRACPRPNGCDFFSRSRRQTCY